MMLAAFLAAQLADAGTYLRLAPGQEANPVVAAMSPTAALLTKALLVLLVVSVAVVLAQRPRYRRAVLVVGVVAGAVGALSNVWALT
jgi:uncharacterized membrane protein YqjE